MRVLLLVLMITTCLIGISCSYKPPFAKEAIVPPRVAVKLANPVWLCVYVRVGVRKDIHGNITDRGKVAKRWVYFGIGTLVGHD